jgi:hypothetical protein
MMNNILDSRTAIYDHFHNSSAGPAYFFKPENADAHAAYYTSMYLIQDTAEAISVHIDSGFSPDALRAYLEFWGVMQAIEIQQDAIFEIHHSVMGRRPKIADTSAWTKLRDTRHLCAGHPARRQHGLPAPQRAFMGRMFGNYTAIKYEMWDAHTQQRTHPTFNLRQMIEAYDVEAGILMSEVLTEMMTRWP